MAKSMKIAAHSRFAGRLNPSALPGNSPDRLVPGSSRPGAEKIAWNRCYGAASGVPIAWLTLGITFSASSSIERTASNLSFQSWPA